MNEVTIMGDGEEIYVVVDGVKVARRGRWGTPQARSWISLEPGWTVKGTQRLEIAYDPPPAH